MSHGRGAARTNRDESTACKSSALPQLIRCRGRAERRGVSSKNAHWQQAGAGEAGWGHSEKTPHLIERASAGCLRCGEWSFDCGRKVNSSVSRRVGE